MKLIRKSFLLVLMMVLFSTGIFASGETVSYQPHIENNGWMIYASNGNLAGTVGQSLRMEALKIKLENVPEGSHIEYSAHVEDYGWMNYVSDD